MEKVKCLYCEYFGLLTKQTGFCLKDKSKRTLEPTICKMYKLGPKDSVMWRMEKIKNGS